MRSSPSSRSAGVLNVSTLSLWNRSSLNSRAAIASRSGWLVAATTLTSAVAGVGSPTR